MNDFYVLPNNKKLNYVLEIELTIRLQNQESEEPQTLN